MDLTSYSQITPTKVRVIVVRGEVVCVAVYFLVLNVIIVYRHLFILFIYVEMENKSNVLDGFVNYVIFNLF